MTREAFIRKWLANPQKQYNEQCRDEMRDDLDNVIEHAQQQVKNLNIPAVVGQSKQLNCCACTHYNSNIINNDKYCKNCKDYCNHTAI